MAAGYNGCMTQPSKKSQAWIYPFSIGIILGLVGNTVSMPWGLKLAVSPM